MKWREGSVGAIKGMLMSMVKRMGTCRAYAITGCRGKNVQLKRSSSGKGVSRKAGGRICWMRYLCTYVTLYCSYR